MLTTVWRNGWGSSSYYSFVVGSSAVGHGVATAHMADHCMGAALYAQKALKLAGKSFEDERNWQLKKLEDLDLADDLVKLIKATIAKKAKGLGL